MIVPASNLCLASPLAFLHSHLIQQNQMKERSMQVGHLEGASSPIVAATNWCLASQLTVSSDVRTKRALIANAANPFVNVLFTLSQSYAAQRNVP